MKTPTEFCQLGILKNIINITRKTARWLVRNPLKAERQENEVYIYTRIFPPKYLLMTLLFHPSFDNSEQEVTAVEYARTYFLVIG